MEIGGIGSQIYNLKAALGSSYNGCGRKDFKAIEARSLVLRLNQIGKEVFIYMMVIHRLEMCTKLMLLAVQFVITLAEAVRFVLRGGAITIIAPLHSYSSIYLPVSGFLVLA
ncbi:hypothetical protein AQUCO_01000314v1 [Aquilegia coerulea]|uniref:Uncharacterized protein n=1 Tax=Aquilegia coerulea TaxID=218851 RepID=A0A2G5E9I5_AQUCA|nr:hypothetical protein AQUCO_01000314v1 [Aquilegia coerulea]